MSKIYLFIINNRIMELKFRIINILIKLRDVLTDDCDWDCFTDF